MTKLEFLLFIQHYLLITLGYAILIFIYVLALQYRENN